MEKIIDIVRQSAALLGDALVPPQLVPPQLVPSQPVTSLQRVGPAVADSAVEGRDGPLPAETARSAGDEPDLG